jgi:hypothetical protein
MLPLHDLFDHQQGWSVVAALLPRGTTGVGRQQKRAVVGGRLTGVFDSSVTEKFPQQVAGMGDQMGHRLLCGVRIAAA